MKKRVLYSDLQEPEGPVCLPDGKIYVVEMSSTRNCVSRIDTYGRYQQVGHPGWRPNGMAIDGDGNLWIAGAGVKKLVRMRPDGVILNTYEGPEGRPYLWPNDLVFGQNGLLYMTDSGIDPDKFFQGQTIRADFRDCEYDGRVFEIDPSNGRVLRVIDSGLSFPNGIAFDANDVLYVGETLTGNIYRYDLISSASIEAKLFGNVVIGSPNDCVGPDGMAFGDDGQLYCAVFGQGDVSVLDCDGRIVERIPTCGIRPTNIAFCEDRTGGAVVTVLDLGCLEWLDLPSRGRGLYRPKLK
ncbi:SMP-30/gluconolactonase/LRE family protein [uncultured Microbulbifer sp.]|uniref:SMP-30/gluconolactonase/LRE family protein n=1 Tax=uncultured Microbulbifer sp. TaxID=348147 RepID=UPI00260D6150|nr:SMP-30/gluconolactonase/LRE family protein [uncultured Microbulbifer sp.]